MIWSISSREGVNGYSKEILPTFTIKDSTAGTEKTVDMEKMSFSYGSKQDDFSLILERELVSSDEYQILDNRYVWYDYRSILSTKIWARGLNKSNYFVQVDLPEGCSASDVIVKKSNGNTTPLIQETVNGKTVWGFYDYTVRNGDYRNNSDGDTEWMFRIGYLAEKFNGKTIDIYTYLNRLYNDETEYQLLIQADDTDYTAHVDSTVIQYTYPYGGYGIWLGKYSSYEGLWIGSNYFSNDNPHSTKNMLATRIFNGVTVEYQIDFSSGKVYGNPTPVSSPINMNAIVNVQAIGNEDDVPDETDVSDEENSSILEEGQKYNVIISDSRMTIHQTDGSDRALTEDEYYFSYLRLPAKSGNYDYEVYASTEIKKNDGNEYNDIYDDPDNLDGYKMIAEGNTRSVNTINFEPNVHSFFVKIKDVSGTFNYKIYPGVYYKFDRDDTIRTDMGSAVRDNNAGHISNYTTAKITYDDNGTEQLYKKTSEVRSNVWLRDPSVTLSSLTDVTYTSAGSAKIIYTMEVNSSGTLISDNEGDLTSFSLYSVVPKYISLDEYMEDLILKGTATDISGNTLTSADFENHVSSYEIKYDSETGKKYICVNFDFCDRPIDFSEQTRIAVNYPAYITLQDFEASESNHNFKFETYIAVHENNITKIVNPNDGVTYITTCDYDLDGDGSTEELMGQSQETVFLPSNPTAWLNTIEKSVGRSSAEPYGLEKVTAYNSAEPADSETNKDCYYTYRLTPKIRNVRTNDLVIYDTLERYSDDSEVSEWQGTLLSVDASRAEAAGFVPSVYYSTNTEQDHSLRVDGKIANGWIRAAYDSTSGLWMIPEDETARVVAIDLGTENFEDGIFEAPKDDTFSCDLFLNMRAPEVSNASRYYRQAYNEHKRG